MCVFALSSGCTFKSDLPTDTEIKCASAEQCPPGWTCDVDAERCRLTGSDSPGLTSNDVTPSIGKQGTVFTLTLMASKPLARAPKIAGLEFVFDEAASAPTDLKYVFTYTAQGTEREGAFRLVAELKDGEGNTANVSVGTVTLDFTAPKPIAGSMKLVPSFARPGQAVLAQVDFDEVLRDGATLTQPELAVTGLMSTVRGTNTLAFRFNVPAAAPSGRYTFGVDSIEDLAGNRADDISAAGELSQGAALTIDSEAPKLEAIVLNRQNFSRVAGFDELQLTFNTGTDAATVTATLADVELTCSQTGMAGALNTWACTRRIDAADTEGVKTVKVSALDLAGLSRDLVTLLPTDRALVHELLTAVRHVDIIIPRGSAALIQFVRENARVPVIETGAGVCHTYVHAAADLAKARDIVVNAKVSRPSVCNALDTVLVDAAVAADFLPLLTADFERYGVEVRADDLAYEVLQNAGYQNLRRAEPADYGREFLDYRCSVKTAAGLDEALEHIRVHSSRHSEAIVSEDAAVCRAFLEEVDAAAVYANASTRFTDGGVFGLGAEIGISTQKLHARGPFALEKLVTEKWVVEGNGQVRC